jgi:hypothetical protein
MTEATWNPDLVCADLYQWECYSEPGFNPSDYIGFVYIIFNMENNRYYIGQKKLWFKRVLRPLKGRKRKRHRIVESDWRAYWGSSEELLRDIERLGKHKFRKQIIRLCKSKAEMNYYESKAQFEKDVLLDPLSYNGIINCRISKNQVYKSITMK